MVCCVSIFKACESNNFGFFDLIIAVCIKYWRSPWCRCLLQVALELEPFVGQRIGGKRFKCLGNRCLNKIYCFGGLLHCSAAASGGSGKY